VPEVTLKTSAQIVAFEKGRHPSVSKQTARNALVVLGIWTLSRVLAWVIEALLIPVSNRLTFVGDLGTLTMWLWQGFPDALVAALAAIALVTVIETRKPTASVSGLSLLYLYRGSLHSWRLLTHGWRVSPRTADYIGIITQAIIPMLACLAVGLWWTRRSTTRETVTQLGN
jgi:hypothetical protein